MSNAFEVNFDGLVGPTHHYAGLSYGNVASQIYQNQPSNPKSAALQGLAKMKMLSGLGMRQAVLPPHPRPSVEMLRRLGFDGTDIEVIAQAQRAAPHLLAAAYSASSMWAANAATVSPRADAQDGRAHFTAANLSANLHRNIEAPWTAQLLRTIFADDSQFAHHDPLAGSSWLSDEGAANHMRLCAKHGKPGVEIFAWGRDPANPDAVQPGRFPARQTRSACEATVRLHQLDLEHVMLIQQNPAVVDAGVFHNDVIAVANENVLFCHESAWVGQQTVLDDVRRRFKATTGAEVCVIEAPESEITITDAVKSYLFNSQLVTRPDGAMALICPSDCQEMPAVREYVKQLIAQDNPIAQLHFVDVRQSMRNGGGPACLRLRVVLDESQWRCVHDGVKFSDSLYQSLYDCVERRYRDHLTHEDLADPAFLAEAHETFAALMRIFQLADML